MLQNPTIKRLINQLWDKFWSGGIANPLTAIEQITYLLFMRIIDAQDFLFIGRFLPPGQADKPENYIDKQELRWRKFKELPEGEMLSRVQLAVFPFLKTELSDEDSPFVKHMQNAVFVIPKPSLMKDAVKLIEQIYTEIDNDAKIKGHTLQDIQGDVYEHLLTGLAQAGRNGQFRTPRHIIDLAVELVRPKINKRIADPACGSGGFLLAAYLYILTQYTTDKDDYLKRDEDGFLRGTRADQLTTKKRLTWESRYFQGFDIDQTMVRMGLMNLMMHGFKNPQVDYRDTLSKEYKEEIKYDYVFANPPFTGNIDKGDINENLKLPTTKTELLFLERIIRMLRPGGTAAVIVPQGVLFGSGSAFKLIRQKMVEEAELKAVITIPSGVFKPYAGVSTALLIFTKAGRTDRTWFYEMKDDGRTLDDKRTKLTGYGDLQDIVTRYHDRANATPADRKGQCFFVSKQDIVDSDYSLGLNIYQEKEYEAVHYDAPRDILAQLRVLETAIVNGIDELEGYLR
ncbi:MAG: SAM-dependent DNA methyltransferase [Cytophagales bacterium]|nr:MAG: SAM-dependent DNA methyltransferase [Cytophagales bacterium]